MTLPATQYDMTVPTSHPPTMANCNAFRYGLPQSDYHQQSGDHVGEQYMEGYQGGSGSGGDYGGFSAAQRQSHAIDETGRRMDVQADEDEDEDELDVKRER